MREMDLLRSILLACSRGPVRLFRQNVGTGWVGKSTRFSRAATVVVQPGDVLIRNARPLEAGLCKGSSDLIGWGPGGRFVALEVKTPTGRVTPGQRQFIEAVTAAGGIGAVARSPDEAIAALRDTK